MKQIFKQVKLYIYEKKSEITYIDSIKAKSFDEFVLITVKGDFDYDRINETWQNIFKGKKLIIIPDGMDIEFYGVGIKEDDDRPTSSELQHEETIKEIT